ncbi:DUF952 domain-containing protein [Panacibacter ginsenosidivorans]|uniref:DUF952 domain-containing protein n=1 Tax=Panacibacter ginsenosidivorans TaxID=1813871 RepID=A0A5B8V6G3_9BACT|nr:DUF952 domain-containing protein [Panacibacter ginsenosidivorans]QEC67050.1 DUF952 domain-containing protein [Panacibacter ginsenosidivorans]
MNNIIYHITTKKEWQTALANGIYQATSLHTEGFIHCSTAQQVAGVLQRYFVGKTDLVKLTIDTLKLHSQFQYDFSSSVNEAFPHVYGAINLDAVIHVGLL